jgi:hypothetical protein
MAQTTIVHVIENGNNESFHHLGWADITFSEDHSAQFFSNQKYNNNSFWYHNSWICKFWFFDLGTILN